MPSAEVKNLIKEMNELKKALTNHLIESGGIKTQLKVNTWLTGLILAALLTKIIAEWFH